jgi:septum formation protein
VKNPTSSLILASTSRYRAQLLSRLRLTFTQVAPQVDETPLPQESPHSLVTRLSAAKAKAVHRHYPSATVIGSDQTAALGQTLLGKPHTRSKAIEQLAILSGQTVDFYTGYCVCSPNHPTVEGVDITRVRFRDLTHAQIERYVDIEQPLDCAGSFKSEGLGVALFHSIENTDPTALIGLPLIQVTQALMQCGLNPFAAE